MRPPVGRAPFAVALWSRPYVWVRRLQRLQRLTQLLYHISWSAPVEGKGGGMRGRPGHSPGPAYHCYYIEDRGIGPVDTPGNRTRDPAFGCQVYGNRLRDLLLAPSRELAQPQGAPRCRS